MAILSTIKVKKNPAIQLQECVRLTSNYFLHLAFDYCALRGIQVQTHHQASFHLSCINNFFYHSQVCNRLLEHCMFLNVFIFTSLLWGNQVHSFPFHRLGTEAQKGKTNHGRAWTWKTKPTLHFRDSVFLLYRNLRSFHNHMLPGAESLRQKENHNENSLENLRIYGTL